MGAENSDWFDLLISEGATLHAPGIYEWVIDGRGSYIGRFTRSSRPLREYRRNVERLAGNLSYRRGNPLGFRKIHRELFAARLAGARVKLVILENPPLSELGNRERELIALRGNLNGTIHDNRTKRSVDPSRHFESD